MPWLLALVFGVLLAGIEQAPTSFFIGGMLGWLLGTVIKLRSEQRGLTIELRDLRRHLAALVTPTAPSAAKVSDQAETPAAALAPIAQPGETPSTEAPAPLPKPVPVAPPAAAVARVSIPTISDRQATPRAPSAVVRHLKSAWEWIAARNPLTIAGIAVLFFGGAFLARYAAEHALFPLEARFIVLAIMALALLLTGWRLRKRVPLYAQILQGGGVAAMYLTIFAATKMFNLLPPTAAFPMMILTVIAAAVLAVAQDALALAIIGTLGGFMVPVLLSSGSGNYIALFSYMAVLNVGVLAIAWYRSWRALTVVGFASTYLLTIAWRVFSYRSDQWLAADAFLILFFLMYLAMLVTDAARRPVPLRSLVSGTLLFGLPVLSFSLHASYVKHIEYALAISALVLGAGYLLLLRWIGRKVSENRLLVEAFAALAIIFASLAIPLAFDGRTTAATWAAEGAGLIWLGARQGKLSPRVFGLLLQAAGALAFLASYNPYADLLIKPPLLNATFVGGLMLAVAGLHSAHTLFRNQGSEHRFERGLHVALLLWGLCWWIAVIVREIDLYFPDIALGAALLVLCVSALVLDQIAYPRKWRPAVLVARLLPLLFAVGGLFHATAILGHPGSEAGLAGWFAMLTVFYRLLFLADARDDSAPLIGWKHAAGYWVLCVAASWELSWQLDQLLGGVWPVLPLGVVPALLLLAVSAASPRPAWPLKQHKYSYQDLGAIVPAIMAILFALGANAFSRGDARPLSYLPIVNPLDVASLMTLLSLLTWWRSIRPAVRTRAMQQARLAPVVTFGGLMFVWANSALIRALHYTVGTPLDVARIMHSVVVQAAVSIFWALLGCAAIILAARRQARWLWFTGATLMGVVLVKLFLIDLANSGTLARVASFMTVGGLLVLTGYFAPLPPKRVTDTGAQ
ncbi:MAG: DUF2339 domain-containing protein [Gammaproteobacteria bacterium]|nr:DUF2339 domain-containing protein [Gammaproteobacteria bacterium]